MERKETTRAVGPDRSSSPTFWLYGPGMSLIFSEPHFPQSARWGRTSPLHSLEMIKLCTGCGSKFCPVKSYMNVWSYFHNHAVKDSYFRAKERRDPLFLFLEKDPRLATGLKPMALLPSRSALQTGSDCPHVRSCRRLAQSGPLASSTVLSLSPRRAPRNQGQVLPGEELGSKPPLLAAPPASLGQTSFPSGWRRTAAPPSCLPLPVGCITTEWLFLQVCSCDCPHPPRQNLSRASCCPEGRLTSTL